MPLTIVKMLLMKTPLTFLPICLFASALSGSVIVGTGFELAGDTWTFTLDPDVRQNAKGDIWDAVTGIGDSTDLKAPDTGSLFWAGRDMDGTALGSTRGWIVFDSIDVSAYENLTLSFSYNYESLSSGSDQMGYMVGTSNDGSDVGLTLDYDVGTDMSLVPDTTVLFKVASGGGFTTSGWVTESIPLPANTTNVALALYAFIDGGYNYVGFDSVQLSGDLAGSTVPEPSHYALFLGGLVLGLLAIKRRRG